MPYDATRGVLKGVNAALRKRDPKEQKALGKDSSAGRRERNLLRRLPKHALLKELLRREAVEQQRANDRERKARWRMRQELKSAVAARAQR